MARVVLIFPPLVERSFGQIYPSTAVLAAYLEARGFPTAQVDLNVRFLDHLLADAELGASAEGRYSRSQLASIAAARWTRRGLVEGWLSKSEFNPDQGLTRGPLEYLLKLLVGPYSVNPDQTALDGSNDDPELLTSYRRFFDDRVQHEVPRFSEDTLVGISVPMGPQLLPALLLASSLRATPGHTAYRIVLGGPALSLLGEPELSRLLRNNPAVDCIVRFDGEYALTALVEQVAADRWAPETVPGTSSRRGDVMTHVAPQAGPDLNALPTPIYRPDMIAGAPHTVLGVTQARGCYWGKCDYCDFVEVYKGSPRVRARRAALVVDDVRRLIEQTGVRRFRVITDSIPPAFARQFATLLNQSGLDIAWSSFAMVDKKFDAELLRLMAASGCEFLIVGLESMVTRALKLVHKSADREENIRFIRDARTAGIRLSINLIPNLPTTTRAEALKGLDDLAQLADYIDKVSVFDFETTRSSAVGRAPAAFGLIPLTRTDRPGQAQLALNMLPVEDPAMSTAERREVLRAYRAFETRVNARRRVGSGAEDGRSYVEVLDGPDGPLLMDFISMERIQFPPALRTRDVGPAAT